MTCTFCFAEEPTPDKVALRLFCDEVGAAKADVTGPLVDRRRVARSGVDRCIVNKETALLAAIRIANTNDTEVVVLGDPELWEPSWGTLTSTPA
jgi:hypothetical protein